MRRKPSAAKRSISSQLGGGWDEVRLVLQAVAREAFAEGYAAHS